MTALASESMTRFIGQPVSIAVFGEPQPQGNKTGFVNKRTGKVVMTEGRRPEARAAFKDWRQAVSQSARDWQAEHGGVAPLDEPVAVDVVFHLTKPASLPRWRWLPSGRPDVDKLARSVLDGITGLLISNDSRVVELNVRKFYAIERWPGAEITVTPWGDYERAQGGAPARRAS